MNAAATNSLSKLRKQTCMYVRMSEYVHSTAYIAGRTKAWNIACGASYNELSAVGNNTIMKTGQFCIGRSNDIRVISNFPPRERCGGWRYQVSSHCRARSVGGKMKRLPEMCPIWQVEINTTCKMLSSSESTKACNSSNVNPEEGRETWDWRN